MARWLAVAGLVVVLGAGLVFLLGDGLDQGPSRDEGIEDPLLEGGGEPLEVGTGGGEQDPITPPTTGEPEGSNTPDRPTTERAGKRTGVFGTVTDPAGNAIAGATVLATKRPRVMRRGAPLGTTLASSKSDGTGVFLIGPLPTKGSFILRASAPGYAPSTITASRRGTRADIVLHRGGAMRIEVVGPAGKAIAGATVSHVVGWNWEALTTTTETGEDGVAAFDSLPTGTGEVIVSAEGYAAVRLRDMGTTPGEPVVQTAVLERSLVARGRVVDRSTLDPVKGARVTMHYPNLPMIPPGEPTPTDEDGGFEIAVATLPGEAVEYRVEHSAYSEARVRRTFADRDEFTVEMQPVGEGIRGRVVNPQRKGVGGVTVTFLGLPEDDDIPSTVSGSDGSFALPLPGHTLNSVQVFAHDEAQGMALQYVNLGTADTGEPRGRITLRLTGAGTVSGMVTGPNGDALESALVELLVDATGSREMVGPGVQPGHVQTALRLGDVALSGVTDAEGYYTIDGVPPLAYVATARLGRLEGRAEELVLVDAYSPTSADIQVAAGGTITGYVVDENERPIAGALVTANALRRLAGGSLRRPSGRTSPDGQFVLYGVDDGRWRLSVTAAGYGSKTMPDVAAGDSDVTATLVKLGWIRGVVEDARGPVEGAFKVEVKRLRGAAGGPGIASTQFIGGAETRTFSTDDGTFEIAGKEAGEYEVRASTTAGDVSEKATKVTVKNGEGSAVVRLRLARGARLHGRVLREAGREALVQAWVNVVPRPGTEGEGATQKGTRSGGKGAYELSGLAAGAYLVKVYTSEGHNFSVPVTLRAGQDRALDLLWRTPGTLRVRVRDENGVFIAEARPVIRSETGEVIQPNYQAMRAEGLIGESANWRSITQTDAEGSLLRHHVPPGKYRVSAVKAGMEPVDEGAWITVYGGREAAADVVLRPKAGD